MATAFNQFWNDLKAPLVANSPMIPSTSANAGNALPFTVAPNAPAPAPAPAPGSNKWMVISLIGAACFGLYYMAGGFGGAGPLAPASGGKRRKSRRRATSRRRASGRRRKGRSKRSRGRVTWGW